MDRCRILQVGLGKWGRDWATQVLPQVTAVQLAGCVDRDAETLRKTLTVGFVAADRCYQSLPSALNDLKPDAVLVTTDAPSHAVVVRTALESGFPVLVEKPLAPSLAEARALAQLSELTGQVVMVSQNYRFFPAAWTVQRMLRSGELGRLLHIDIDFRRFLPPPASGKTAHSGWVQPLLLDMSIHHFDLLRAIIGTEPTSVDCAAWNPSWAGYDDPPEGTALIAFGSVAVTYRGSWICPDRVTPWAGEWRMEFEDGELWWTSQADEQTAHADEVWRYDHGGQRRAVQLDNVRSVGRQGVLWAFVQALPAGTSVETSVGDNLGSLGLAYASIESAQRGAPVIIHADRGLELAAGKREHPGDNSAEADASKKEGTCLSEANVCHLL